MKVILINSSGTKDITQLITKITWSGDYQQAARKLETNVAVSPTDYYLPKIYIALGNMLKLLTDDGIELFQGYVFYKEKSISNNEMRITAYDGLIYLLKSKGTYNFKKMTAEAITKKVADDFGIPVGTLANTGIVQSFIADGQTIYDIIMQAYTNASKQNGKKYMPIMQQGKLNVIEKGKSVARYVLSSDSNIEDATYTESIENMINRVKIYDENKNLIGTVENSEWIKLYGILQEVYVKEKDKNPQIVAKNMLKGVERTASLSGVLGNTDCITGMAVQVKESYTGLVGLFYIDTDTHTWQNGQYTMDLGLSFQNVMDEKEATA
ncbi:MAG: XkdQ/YqbQ family protein [Thermovenabulum sp.]|uniref:XkdQ/YqbQ family protein n=1 Tax=Thermovenabulum sp. TaxID=3100335 RepID=UPI003C79A696